MIRVTIDTSGIIPWQARTEATVRQAARMAGGDAIRSMRTEAGRLIRERKALKLSTVRDSLSTIFPASSGQHLVWRLEASSAAMPVSAFGARQTKRGVSAEINRGARKVIPGTFLAQMKSGHVGVFYRSGKERLPISEAYTTRVSDAFIDAIPAVAEKGESVFRATFARVLQARVGELRARM